MDVRDDVVDILSGFSLFADLSTPERESLVDTFSEETFQVGDRVLRQGLSGSNFYVVLEGTASIMADGVDRSMVRPGDYFGEISTLLGVPPPSDIVAPHPPLCLAPPAAHLPAIPRPHPPPLHPLLQRATLP